MADSSCVPGQTGSVRRVILLFVRMNLAYYRTHLVSLFMTLALPLVFLVIYAFAYMSSSGPSKIQVALSPSAQKFLAGRLGNVPADAVNVIPSNMSAPESMKKLSVQIAVDTDVHSGNLVVYSLPSASGLANIMAGSLAKTADVPSVSRKVQVRSYRDPMAPLSFLPGVLLMSILNLALFTTGSKMLQERAQGTLRLFRMLPSPFWCFLGAELLGKLAISLVQTTAFIILALLVTGISLSASAVILAILTSLLATVCLLSLGIALGSWLGSFSSGVHVFTLVNLFVVFLGDLFFPASSFYITKPIALLLPTTYCADLLRHVMFDQELSFPLVFSLGYLVTFTALAAFFAARVFRFTARS